MILTHRGRSELPRAPYEIQEVVELHFRKHGRTATLHYAPVVGWFARVSLRSNDKRMLAWREGRAPAPPTEDVYFHYPNPRHGNGNRREPPFIALDILQMGPTGVQEFLERGDTWSGRGEHTSLVEQARKAREHKRYEKLKLRDQNRVDARLMARDQRRSRLKIPYLGVGIDLKHPKKEK